MVRSINYIMDCWALFEIQNLQIFIHLELGIAI